MGVDRKDSADKECQNRNGISSMQGLEELPKHIYIHGTIIPDL